MVSRPPTILDLDRIAAQILASPEHANKATALAKIAAQRAALVGPETATGEIGEVLRALESGALSTEAAAARFGAMDWTGPPAARTLADLDDDPGPPTPFAAIGSAYVEGRITDQQYAAIVEAIAAAQRN
jgi:hypothetical protein